MLVHIRGHVCNHGQLYPPWLLSDFSVYLHHPLGVGVGDLVLVSHSQLEDLGTVIAYSESHHQVIVIRSRELDTWEMVIRFRELEDLEMVIRFGGQEDLEIVIRLSEF